MSSKQAQSLRSFLSLLLLVLTYFETEVRAWHLVGNHSVTQLQPWPALFFFFKMEYHYGAQVGLQLVL